MRATSVRTDRVADAPPIPDVASLGVAAGGGRTTPIDAVTRPPFERFYAFSEPPAGFVAAGRYAVVPPGSPAGRRWWPTCTPTALTS